MKSKIEKKISINKRAESLFQVTKKAFADRTAQKYFVYFTMAFLASGASFADTQYPFGVAMAAAFAFTELNLFVFLGAALGYPVFHGAEGIVYLGALVVTSAMGVMTPSEYKNKAYAPIVAAVSLVFTSAFYKIGVGTGLWTAAAEMIICALFAAGYSFLEGEADARYKNAGKIAVFLTLILFLYPIRLFEIIAVSNIIVIFGILLYIYSGKEQNSIAAAVAYGLLIDINRGDIYYSGIYGIAVSVIKVCKLKDKVKIGAAFWFLTAAVAMMFGNLTAALSVMLESLAACLAFALIPQPAVNNISSWLYIASEEKKQYKDKPKDEIAQKLSALSEAFCHMSEQIERTVFKGRYNLQDISSVFDRAADNVCRKCPIAGNCWDKDYMTTYGAMNDVTAALNKKGYITAADFPHHFAARCLNINNLLGHINREYSLFARRRLKEQSDEEKRSIMAKQYRGMQKTIDGLAEGAAGKASYYPEYESRIGQLVRYYDKNAKVTVQEENGRMRVEIFGAKRELIDDLNQIKDSISLSTAREFENFESFFVGKKIVFRTEEKERFQIKVNVGIREKKGEKVCGDNHMYFVTDDGRAVLMLSDGMGSGKEAYEASRNALALISGFVKAGCSIEESVTAVMPVLSVNVERTGFVTLDLLEINMFTGESRMIKYGASPTYVKRGRKVQKYVSTAFPPGLDDMTEQLSPSVYFKLREGNTVIMGTDGALENADTAQVENIIRDMSSPDRLVNALIEKGLEGGENESDDMTVLVINLKKAD